MTLTGPIEMEPHLKGTWGAFWRTSPRQALFATGASPAKAVSVRDWNSGGLFVPAAGAGSPDHLGLPAALGSGQSRIWLTTHRSRQRFAIVARGSRDSLNEFESWSRHMT